MGTRRQSQTSARRIIARQREARAMEMRLAGHTYAEIAEALGISSVSAYQAVRRVLDRLAERTNETAEQVRKIEESRLDELLRSLWDRRHDPKIVDRILRIMERRARLLGLDKPTQVDVQGLIQVVIDE